MDETDVRKAIGGVARMVGLSAGAARRLADAAVDELERDDPSPTAPDVCHLYLDKDGAVRQFRFHGGELKRFTDEATMVTRFQLRGQMQSSHWPVDLTPAQAEGYATLHWQGKAFEFTRAYLTDATFSPGTVEATFALTGYKGEK